MKRGRWHRGTQRHSCRKKGICALGELAFRGPKGRWRWLALRPRGSHPRRAAGAQARPLPSQSAPFHLPRPYPASSLLPLSYKPPSRPFPSVSVTAGALGRAECRRCDSRVPGLPAPAAREQQAPGICSLLTGPRHAADGAAAPPSFSQGTGQRRVSNTSVQCRGVESSRGCRKLCGPMMGEGTRDYLYGYSLQTLPRTHWSAYTNFCTVTLLHIGCRNKTSHCYTK